MVNATGLGAKGLIGVEDHNVYPARGQTILVRAPKVRTCIMRADMFLSNMTVKDGSSGESGMSLHLMLHASCLLFHLALARAHTQPRLHRRISSRGLDPRGM